MLFHYSVSLHSALDSIPGGLILVGFFKARLGRWVGEDRIDLSLASDIQCQMRCHSSM